MGKAEKRAAAIENLKAAAKGDDCPPEALAALTLVGDMLDSLDRIAAALEKRNLLDHPLSGG